jgi:hypothetical protein
MKQPAAVFARSEQTNCKFTRKFGYVLSKTPVRVERARFNRHGHVREREKNKRKHTSRRYHSRDPFPYVRGCVSQRVGTANDTR